MAFGNSIAILIQRLHCSSGKPARLDAQKRSSLHNLVAVLDANWLLRNTIAIRNKRMESPGPFVELEDHRVGGMIQPGRSSPTCVIAMLYSIPTLDTFGSVAAPGGRPCIPLQVPKLLGVEPYPNCNGRASSVTNTVQFRQVRKTCCAETLLSPQTSGRFGRKLAPRKQHCNLEPEAGVSGSSC